MAHTSKRYNGIRTKVDHVKLYPVQEALKIVKENATARFNESVDVSINLGVDPKKSDQVVRGAVVRTAGVSWSVMSSAPILRPHDRANRGCRGPGHPCAQATRVPRGPAVLSASSQTLQV